MAQYKVIQDIEAEDKLLGPLTLRQFIYAAITVILGFIAYKFAAISPYLIIPFLPEMIFFGVLAAPFGIDQPNEVWLLAKIKFYLKPQTRKWNQDGVSGLVTITVPKKIEKQLVKDLTASEAKSKLESLAKILDSGGIAVNNKPSMFRRSTLKKPTEDRLVELDMIGQNQPSTDIVDQDDIFDESNFQARHINSVVTENEKKIRDYQKSLVLPHVAPDVSSDEAPVLSPIKEAREERSYLSGTPNQPSFGHIESRFNPSNVINISPVPTQKISNNQSPVTTQPDNAKINILASDNNRTIASMKHEFNGGDDSGEVVIPH